MKNQNIKFFALFALVIFMFVAFTTNTTTFAQGETKGKIDLGKGDDPITACTPKPVVAKKTPRAKISSTSVKPAPAQKCCGVYNDKDLKTLVKTEIELQTKELGGKIDKIAEGFGKELSKTNGKVDEAKNEITETKKSVQKIETSLDYFPYIFWSLLAIIALLAIIGIIVLICCLIARSQRRALNENVTRVYNRVDDEFAEARVHRTQSQQFREALATHYGWAPVQTPPPPDDDDEVHEGQVV